MTRSRYKDLLNLVSNRGIENLPLEIIHTILKYLDAGDLANFSAVSTWWKYIIDNCPILWREFFPHKLDWFIELSIPRSFRRHNEWCMDKELFMDWKQTNRNIRKGEYFCLKLGKVSQCVAIGHWGLCVIHDRGLIRVYTVRENNRFQTVAFLDRQEVQFSKIQSNDSLIAIDVVHTTKGYKRTLIFAHPSSSRKYEFKGILLVTNELQISFLASDNLLELNQKYMDPISQNLNLATDIACHPVAQDFLAIHLSQDENVIMLYSLKDKRVIFNVVWIGTSLLKCFFRPSPVILLNENADGWWSATEGLYSLISIPGTDFCDFSNLFLEPGQMNMKNDMRVITCTGPDIDTIMNWVQLLEVDVLRVVSHMGHYLTCFDVTVSPPSIAWSVFLEHTCEDIKPNPPYFIFVWIGFSCSVFDVTTGEWLWDHNFFALEKKIQITRKFLFCLQDDGLYILLFDV